VYIGISREWVDIYPIHSDLSAEVFDIVFFDQVLGDRGDKDDHYRYQCYDGYNDTQQNIPDLFGSWIHN
jgi:hypothetical protein